MIKKTSFLLKFMILSVTSITLPFLTLSAPAQSMEEVEFVKLINGNLQQPVDAVVSSIGDIVVLDRKLGEIFVLNSENIVKTHIAEHGSLPGQLHKPQSLAISRKGEIIVADTGNSRVEVFEPNGDFSYEIGGFGMNDGQFKKPVSVAVDQLGYIFVADQGKDTISKFSPNGVFLESFDVQGSPQDITFDLKQNMYVLFPKEGKISIFSNSDGIQKDIVIKDDDKNYISYASSIAVDVRGDIYFIELANHSIMKIDQDGNILFTFGSKGIGKGQFEQPSGIFADSSGQILVADTDNKRVQVLEIKGSSKAELKPTVYQLPLIDFDSSITSKKEIVDLSISSQGLYALQDNQGQVLLMDPIGDNLRPLENQNNELNKPEAFHVFKDGSMLLTDTGNHRLTFLNPNGTVEYQFGTKGNHRSEFYGLQGVTVDREGYIYVADTKNNRIQVFNNDGIYLRSFGSEQSSGNDLSSLSNPKDLVFNSNEDLFVLDYKNKRIQVFAKDGTYLRTIGGNLDKKVSFDDIIDIDIDEYDYLYVADRGDHSVKILDTNGKLVKKFGSIGKGPSFFPELSSIASSQGKIYVSNYALDKITVFDFKPDVMLKGNELLYLTRISQPLEMENASEEIRIQMARKLTLEAVKEEIVKKVGAQEVKINNEIKIVEEQYLGDGRLQITVSIPKSIIPQEYTVLGMKK